MKADNNLYISNSLNHKTNGGYSHNIMKRGNFILSFLSAISFTTFGKTKMQERNTAGFKVGAGEARFGESFRMKGVTLNVLDNKISSTDTNGDLAVFEQNGFTPKGGPPLHIHPYQDEFFYIVDGDYLFQVGEQKYEMKAGDTIFLPRNVQHAFVQLTERAKVIVAYMPAGKMEGFFKTTDAWTSPPSRDQIRKAFEDHDMRVVGPPLKAS